MMCPILTLDVITLAVVKRRDANDTLTPNHELKSKMRFQVIVCSAGTNFDADDFRIYHTAVVDVVGESAW